MKKNYLLAAGLFLHVLSFGQIPLGSPPSNNIIDTSFNNYVNHVFGLLEPDRVSTGLLLDYAFEFTDPKIYNGSASFHDSTLVEQGIYSELY